MFPDLALLDSRYLAAVPYRTTVNTALDAMSHCIESYLAVRADKLSSLLALDGAREIYRCFPALIAGETGKKEYESLQYGALLGGIVIAQTATTAVHAMGYSLTYFRHIDHGRANGLLLTEYLRYTANALPEKVSELLHGIGAESLDELDAGIGALLGEKEKFTEKELEDYSKIAVTAKNIKNCVAEPDVSALLDIYRKSLI